MTAMGLYPSSLFYDVLAMKSETPTRQPICPAYFYLRWRADGHLAHSPVGKGLIERLHLLNSYALLWIAGELVELEDLIMHEAAHGNCSPTTL